MARRTDKAVQIFSAQCRGKLRKDNEEGRKAIAGANKAMQSLAKNPTPGNRYEIAQIIAFSVQDIIDQSNNFLNTVADMQNVGMGQKAEFTVTLDGIKAYIQAKGGTTFRSKILTKNFSISTMAVSARPVVDFYSLAAGKVDFTAVVKDASFKMENAKLQKIQNVLYKSIKNYKTPNYDTGSGVVAQTIDPQIVAFSRLGGVTLMGDLAVVSKFAKLTGWNGAFSQDIINEQNENGYIGKYNGANVIKLSNPPLNNSLTDTYLRKNMVWILPSGDPTLRPLKVTTEGDILPMDQTNLNDRSYEIRLDQQFGAAMVVGNRMYFGAYEDSSVSA